MKNDIEELQTKADRVLDQCSVWSEIGDGSYEACLSYCGYYAILADISKLEQGKEDEIL
jgi:hypothetical protein